MRRAFAALAITAAVTTSAAVAQTPSSASAASFPAWAYPWVPDFKVAPADDVPQHVPDSTASFSTKQERDLFMVPDWHPGEHTGVPGVGASVRNISVARS